MSRGWQGWNGGRWSPSLPGGPSGYSGPGSTPPFHEWTHLAVDEQIQRAKDWRAQHSRYLQSPSPFSAPALVSTLPTPARSSSPGPLQPPALRPDPDPGGAPGVPNRPSTAPGPPPPDHPAAADTDAVPQQGGFERESSFEEDYKRWESQVVHGQPPVPTSHILVPCVPAPGPPTTPFYISPPAPPTRHHRCSIISQPPIPGPASTVPPSALEGLTIRSQPRNALSKSPSSSPAHSSPSASRAPGTEGQTPPLESLDRPAAADWLSGPETTGAAIESTPVSPGVGDEPSGPATEFCTASDDPAVQRAVREVEAQVEKREFQPLTAPVQGPPPRPSDTEAVSKKTAEDRAKKARQKANKKAKKPAVAVEGSGDPGAYNNSDRMKDDGKRKATEDPTSPAAAKRVKHDDSAEPPPKPKMAVIPFPEKVCAESDAGPTTVVSMLT